MGQFLLTFLFKQSDEFIELFSGLSYPCQMGGDFFGGGSLLLADGTCRFNRAGDFVDGGIPFCQRGPVRQHGQPRWQR